MYKLLCIYLIGFDFTQNIGGLTGFKNNISKCAVPLLLHILANSNLGFDFTDAIFEVPVTTLTGLSCEVIRCSHISVSQSCKGVDEVFTSGSRGQVTTVDQQVGIFG